MDTVIRLTVDPQAGVSDLAPDTAVISIPDAQELDVAQVRASCCNPGRFFATPEAAADWLARYPRGSVLPVGEAYPHLRSISSRLLG
jgi:alkylmercury lyase